VPLLMETNTFGLGRKHLNSSQWCENVHVRCFGMKIPSMSEVLSTSISLLLSIITSILTQVILLQTQEH